MWNAIVRKVQSFFQPQQSEASKLISRVKPPTAQQQQQLSQIDKFIGEGPVKDSSAQLKTSATIGGTSGGGGGQQPAPTGGSDADLTRGKNVGDKITISGRTYKIVDPSRGIYEAEWGDPSWNAYKAEQAAQEAQRKATTPAVTPVPTPVPTPAQPQIFNMGALQRKLQETASSIGQGLTKGVADLGAAIQRRGEVQAGDRGSATNLPKTDWLQKGLNIAGTFLPGAKALGDVYSKVQAPVGSWGTKEIGLTEKLSDLLGKQRTDKGGSNIFGAPTTKPPIKPPIKTPELPTTPEGIFAGSGGGAVGEQGQMFTGLQNQEVRDMILQELMATSNQIANMPTEDLDAAYTKMAEELGVTKQQAVLNDLNTQVLSVTDEIEAIDGQVTREAGNVLMTEDQRRRLISARAQPLREQLTKLMRSAQYAGVGLDSLMKMLNDRMAAKKDTITTQFQAAQMAQSAEEQRKNRLLGLLPYVKPTAQTLSSNKGYVGNQITPETGEQTIASLLQ
ncbi:MAG: hypothetical protein UT24_C0016G0061 [Candidatus Woesebacteria bacterium GW2011_GWB1_39_12]|uniref:Uncharacterized protein n=1 Tax=Candidatus Woesebacteria bacterium GW2011_GWB1_39_12 TaxID=1618574 RepID=A0A0G0QEN9_9BACT|nr:MAG: hypothetical protein UT24_C0016G0061 [Candidatus Woesebacteria bacterium GW2011_GWB1_39_12]